MGRLYGAVPAVLGVFPHKTGVLRAAVEVHFFITLAHLDSLPHLEGYFLNSRVKDVAYLRVGLLDVALGYACKLPILLALRHRADPFFTRAEAGNE